MVPFSEQGGYAYRVSVLHIERFLIECRKTSQSQRTQKHPVNQSKLEVHVAEAKRGKTSASVLQLVLVLFQSDEKVARVF